MGSIKLTDKMKTFIIISLLIVASNAQFFRGFNTGGRRFNGGGGRFNGGGLVGGLLNGLGSNQRRNTGVRGSNNQGCVGSFCNQINFNGGGGGRGNNNQGCIDSRCSQINFNTGGGGLSFGSSSNNNQGCTGGSRCNQINFAK